MVSDAFSTRPLDLKSTSTVKVQSMTDAPNHHAHHPGFAGATGLLAALTMTRRRDDAAELAIELGHLRPGDTVVDIGCGPGIALRHAARLGADAIGVEPAAVMRRVAGFICR